MSTEAASAEQVTLPSPIKERSMSLENALQHRPDPKDLLNRNILIAPVTTSHAVVQRQLELEKQMTQDALKRHLKARPEKEDLVNRNIIHNSTAGPTIQAHQRELERSMLEDSLNVKLAHRPQPAEIIEKGILGPEEDPTIL